MQVQLYSCWKDLCYSQGNILLIRGKLCWEPGCMCSTFFVCTMCIKNLYILVGRDSNAWFLHGQLCICFFRIDCCLTLILYSDVVVYFLWLEIYISALYYCLQCFILVLILILQFQRDFLKLDLIRDIFRFSYFCSTEHWTFFNSM